MRFAATLMAALALFGCSPVQQPNISEIETAASAGEISPDGYGQIHIGVSLQEARSLLGAALGQDESGGGQACMNLPYAAEAGQTLYVMVEEGRVTRITAVESGSAVRTPEGVGVGSSDAEVRAAYPQAIEEPAKYAPSPAHDLIVWWTPNESGMRFEIGADGKVAAMHVGGQSILYVEGCA